MDPLFRKLSPYIGLFAGIALFLFTAKVGQGRLGFGNWLVIDLPDGLYANNITAYFGFLPRGFSSSDYVPLLPWLFSYWVGYFTYRVFEKQQWLKYLSDLSFKPLKWVGRHSLIIYLLHQPIAYGFLFVLFKIL